MMDGQEDQGRRVILDNFFISSVCNLRFLDILTFLTIAVYLISFCEAPLLYLRKLLSESLRESDVCKAMILKSCTF